MLNKIKVVIVFALFYQNAVYSNITSFNDFKSKNLSNYFSGLVATENKNNSEALDFFNSSKILINRHNPYLEKYIYSLVLENKISQAINEIKRNKKNENSNFFDAYLLLILDSLKKNDLDQANLYLSDGLRFVKEDRFNLAILESLNQFIFSFKEKKILDNKKNFGTLSLISETFQRCYLGDKKTGAYFSNLINDNEADYSRYVYFYLSYLVESGRELDAKIVADDINYINTSLLLSQGKSWIDKKNFYKFKEVFSCKNYNDIISEFLFLISNLYSSQDDFIKSNFYLNLSNFLNPKFTFNLSLVAENYFLNKQYKKTMKVLRNFIEEDDFYYWYRIKKEAQIIKEQNNENLSLDFITRKFNEIDQPSNKQLFDIANFYRNSKKYKKAIKYYTEILDSLDEESEIKSDIFYRRGSSYERLGSYEKADKDFKDSLNINPDDAYVLNYLAYSWLERNFKINEAIEMLERAYLLKSNDPYIIDSIGWAYFLIDDYIKAEKFLIRAVKLMPNDPIVNDHYGDILWKLDRKIQARYFWKNVLEMEDVEKDMKEKINLKIIEGLKKS